MAIMSDWKDYYLSQSIRSVPKTVECFGEVYESREHRKLRELGANPKRSGRRLPNVPVKTVMDIMTPHARKRAMRRGLRRMYR